MVRVKQAMGVFILATAAYYAWVGYGILSARWVDPSDVRAGVEEQLESRLARVARRRPAGGRA